MRLGKTEKEGGEQGEVGKERWPAEKECEIAATSICRA